MSEASWKSGTPKIILLATDLSSRCDRALDRALQLALQWQARLVVLTVLEFKDGQARLGQEELPVKGSPEDGADIVMRQIRRDLNFALPASCELPDMEICLDEGDPATRIVEAARTMGAGLIITGVARDETLGRTLLGTTVQRLARQTSVPVLVVKTRARPYRDILVATDFSDSSRHALDAAFSFFPRVPKTLFHAFEVPFPALLDKGNARDEYRALEQKACDKFLDESGLSEEQRRVTRTVIEHGAPTAIMCAYMAKNEMDIAVIGTHGRGAAFDMVMGSTAKQFLDHAPGDVLLVREPRSVKLSAVLAQTPLGIRRA